MEFLQYFFYCSLSYYCIILLLLRNSLLNFHPQNNKNNTISVIIAVKNGENSLDRLIKSLINQTYLGNIEFIFIDDNSTDNSNKIIRKYKKLDDRIILISSDSGNKFLAHKKKAIDAGIKISKGDILLFTDVDCKLPANWVTNMSSYFSKKIDYVVGYSEVPFSSNLVTLFQKLDFFMLMNATHSSINLNWYWACSGQNQAYKKSLYEKNNGFDEISNLLQGDDTLFFQISAKKNDNFNADFAYNPLNKVFCRQEYSLKSFLLQRIRWSGDAIKTWKYNFHFFSMAVLTFLTNFILIINLLLYIFGMLTLNQFLFPLIIKFISEYLFALKGMKVHNDQYTIFQFVYWFIMQPVYIVIIGIGSFFQSYLSWRD